MIIGTKRVHLRAIILFGIGLMASVQMMFAHGEIHDLIDRATEKISADSSNPAHFLLRGRLYSLDLSFSKALEDLHTVK